MDLCTNALFSHTSFLCELDEHLQQPLRHLCNELLFRRDRLNFFRQAVMSHNRALQVAGYDSEDTETITYMESDTTGDVQLETIPDQVGTGKIHLFEDVVASFNFLKVNRDRNIISAAVGISCESRNVIHSGASLHWLPANELKFMWGLDEDWKELFGEERFNILTSFFLQNFVRCLGQARSECEMMAFWLPSKLNELRRASRQAMASLKPHSPASVIAYAPIQVKCF